MCATGKRRAELEDEVELLRTDAAAPVVASPGFEQLMSRKRRSGLSYFTAQELEQHEDDGSRTRSQLLAMIGERWRALPAAEQAAFQAAAAKEDAQLVHFPFPCVYEVRVRGESGSGRGDVLSGGSSREAGI